MLYTAVQRRVCFAVWFRFPPSLAGSLILSFTRLLRNLPDTSESNADRVAVIESSHVEHPARWTRAGKLFLNLYVHKRHTFASFRQMLVVFLYVIPVRSKQRQYIIPPYFCGNQFSPGSDPVTKSGARRTTTLLAMWWSRGRFCAAVSLKSRRLVLSQHIQTREARRKRLSRSEMWAHFAVVVV